MDRTMTRRIFTGAVALSLLAGGGVLAGCGSSSSSSDTAASRAAADAATQVPNGVEKLPAKEIVAASLAAARAESSVRVRGTNADEGGAESGLDLQIGNDAGQGTISLGPIRMEMRRVDGTIYYKTSAEDFARIVGTPDNPEDAKALAALLDDNWIRQGADDESFVAFEEFLQKDLLLKGLLAPEGTATVKGTDTVDGTPVVLVSDGRGDGPATLAVRTVGPPLPVQVTETGSGSDSAVMTFSDWGAPVSVTAPTNVISPEDFERLVQERTGSASG
jgi:hypothetical protein